MKTDFAQKYTPFFAIINEERVAAAPPRPSDKKEWNLSTLMTLFVNYPLPLQITLDVPAAGRTLSYIGNS